MARYLLKLAHTWPLEHPNGIKFTSCAIQVDQTAQVFDACRDSDVVGFMQIIKITGNLCMELASVRGKYQSWGCHRTGRKVTNPQISCSAHIFICALAKHAAYGRTHLWIRRSSRIRLSTLPADEPLPGSLARVSFRESPELLKWHLCEYIAKGGSCHLP